MLELTFMLLLARTLWQMPINIFKLHMLIFIIQVNSLVPQLDSSACHPSPTHVTKRVCFDWKTDYLKKCLAIASNKSLTQALTDPNKCCFRTYQWVCWFIGFYMGSDRLTRPLLNIASGWWATWYKTVTNSILINSGNDLLSCSSQIVSYIYEAAVSDSDNWIFYKTDCDI